MQKSYIGRFIPKFLRTALIITAVSIPTFLFVYTRYQENDYVQTIPEGAQIEVYKTPKAEMPVVYDLYPDSLIKELYSPAIPVPLAEIEMPIEYENMEPEIEKSESMIERKDPEPERISEPPRAELGAAGSVNSGYRRITFYYCRQIPGYPIGDGGGFCGPPVESQPSGEVAACGSAYRRGARVLIHGYREVPVPCIDTGNLGPWQVDIWYYSNGGPEDGGPWESDFMKLGGYAIVEVIE